MSGRRAVRTHIVEVWSEAPTPCPVCAELRAPDPFCRWACAAPGGWRVVKGPWPEAQALAYADRARQLWQETQTYRVVSIDEKQAS